MTPLAPTLAPAAGLAIVAAAGFATAQIAAPQPKAAQPGMMGRIPGMQQIPLRMMAGAAEPTSADPYRPIAMPSGDCGAVAFGRSFPAAKEKVHRDIAITYPWNADRGFPAGMIPHHQDAIEMAQVVLEHSSDPAVRAIAIAAILDQKRENTQLRAIFARIPAR